MHYSEFQDEIRFDFFKLHDDKIDDKPEKWICASKKEVGQAVIELVITAVKIGQISKRDLSRSIAKKLGISIVSSDRLVHGRKDWFPLIFIEELLKLTKQENEKYSILAKITELKVSQPPLTIVKTPQFLTSNLCKIAGAHAADGTLSENYFCITDGDKLNLVAFQRWVKEEFNLDKKINQIGENEWGIRFHNKIFTRCLHVFFGFPNGRKCETTGMPEIIRKSKKECRRAFAIGAMGFEAGLGSSRDVSLCVLSKKFRDDLAEISIENGLSITIPDTAPSNYWRFWSGRLSDRGAGDWIQLFEPNTEKWHKLQEYCFGYEGKVNDVEDGIMAIQKIYPKLSATKVSTVDVLLILKKMKEANRYKIVESLKKEKNLVNYGGKWGHSLRNHLQILKSANIITVRRQRFEAKKSFGTIVREVYVYNPNVKEWLVPKRESLKEIH